MDQSQLSWIKDLIWGDASGAIERVAAVDRQDRPAGCIHVGATTAPRAPRASARWLSLLLSSCEMKRHATDGAAESVRVRLNLPGLSIALGAMAPVHERAEPERYPRAGKEVAGGAIVGAHREMEVRDRCCPRLTVGVVGGMLDERGAALSPTEIGAPDAIDQSPSGLSVGALDFDGAS